MLCIIQQKKAHDRLTGVYLVRAYASPKSPSATSDTRETLDEIVKYI